MQRRQFLTAAASLFTSPLYPQDQPDFTTEVKLVNLLASVRTPKGAIIRDLSQADFQLTENGHPQTIRYFSRETDLPLTLGLLIDTSMSQKRVLEAERIASFRFLDQVLRETKDKIFLMSFDSSAVVDQPLTNSRRQLDESLSYIDTPTRKELALQGGGSTVLYDAVAKAAAEILAPQPNRKAVIILSDGVDTGSNLTLAQAADAALRADTLIYSILFTDSRAYPAFMGADGRGALVRLSRDTGGAFFEVTRKQSLEQIYNLIQEELRSQYSLAFVSDQPVRLSEFRKLRLTLPNHKNLIVQTRDRYWAKR